MPTGELRIGQNPNANGGRIREDLVLPTLDNYEVKEVASSATAGASSRPPVASVSTPATSSS